MLGLQSYLINVGVLEEEARLWTLMEYASVQHISGVNWERFASNWVMIWLLER